MYSSRETMVAKANQLKKMGLYPEAVIIAREMTERWPDHPSGWSYLTEIYGYYYGMGTEAAKAVQKGIQCRELRNTIYWEPLTVQSMYFADNPDQLEKGIDNILEYFPKNQVASDANNFKLQFKGVITNHALAAFHCVCGKALSDENARPGFSASHWDLACSQLLKISEVNEFRIVFDYLINELLSADEQIKSHRQNIGLGFAPEDRLSLKYRSVLFEQFIPKYFPKDPQIHNKWAATYGTLEVYDEFQRIISVSLELQRYDKPLLNKSGILFTQGRNDLYSGDRSSAQNKFKEAISCLEEAILLGGEPQSQQKASRNLDQIKMVLNLCDIKNIPVSVTKEGLQNLSKGIEKWLQMQMKEMTMMKHQSGFTSAIAAQSANKRLNMNDYAGVLQCAIELMEDMLPPFAFSIISRFRSQGRTFELFTLALSDIASNIEKYGAMHRDAQETLAILLLEANGPENIHQTFLCLNTLFPHLSETVLHSIHITFGSQLEISLQGIIKTEQPPSLPDDFIWWRTTKSSESTKDNSLFQKLFRMIIRRININ